MVMKNRIKKLWVEALRSGDYEQGEQTLRKGDKFCCLGVLCDLYQKEMDDDSINWIPHDNVGGYRFLGRGGALPREVWEWANLPWDDPRPEREDKTLSELNDAGKTFKQIADMIEKQKLVDAALETGLPDTPTG